jgi:hypothetical protein
VGNRINHDLDFITNLINNQIREPSQPQPTDFSKNYRALFREKRKELENLIHSSAKSLSRSQTALPISTAGQTIFLGRQVVKKMTLSVMGTN